VILILLGGLAFVFPLAVYCVILATLNRQKHPVMVAGGWDFVQVIFGCSGFLVFGGPAILTGFSQRWRAYWLTGRKGALPTMGDDWWLFWFLIWGVYFAIVLGTVIGVIYRRQRQTAIYNIQPGTLHDSIGLVLDRLGFDWKRDRQGYLIGPRAIVGVEAGKPLPAQPMPRFEPGTEIELAIDTFPGMRHATLTWQAEAGSVRQEVEDELAGVFSELDLPANPVGTWLLWIGGFLFLAMFFAIVFMMTLIFYIMRQGI
jgi:hypothetical protein